MSEKTCPHKLLRKQLSGMQVWYVCVEMGTCDLHPGLHVKNMDCLNFKPETGCGQKFKVEEWDGKVRVLSSTQQSTK